MAYSFRLIFLLQLLCFSTAAVPSVSLGSLNQLGAASALNFSGSPIHSSSPGTTAVAGIFPQVYYVPSTHPQMILQVRPTVHLAYRPYAMASAVIYGLNIAVEQCIVHKGDTKVPAVGVAFAPSNVGVNIKPSSPRVFDFTYSTVATVLRGIWELTAYYGSYTLIVDIFVGAVTPAHYAGYATAYIKVGDSNVTVDTVAPLYFSDTAILRA